MQLHEIARALQDAGLTPRGAFHPAAADGVPDRRYNFYQPHVKHVVIHEGKLAEVLGHFEDRPDTVFSLG